MAIHAAPLVSELNRHLLYLDPGAGSMLLQMAIAAVLGLGVIIRMQWANIKKLFGKKGEINKPENDNDEE